MNNYLLKKGQINIFNVLVGIIFLLFLILGGYFVYKLFYGPTEGDIIVPNVIGYDIYDAKNNLKLIGLEIEVVSTSFSDKPKNMILNQEPPAGVKVKKGRIIKVVISKGDTSDKLFLLPDLVGYNINQFNINPNLKFNKLDLVYNYIYYPSMSFKDGTILMQSPEPNTALNKDKKLSFLVSKEINPQELINNSKDYLPESWKDLDKADSLFIQFKNSDVIEDRKITTSYIYNNTIIIDANLNYSQIPDIKIINLVLKFKYSKDISNVKVYLEDFLGKRLIVDSYYVGQIFSNLKVFYIGDAKVSVYLNNNKVADYSLP